MKYTTEFLLRHPVLWAKLLASEPEAFWQKRGREMARRLFRNMERHVPAYKKYLAGHGERRGNGWEQIPIVSKDSYLRHYPLSELLWNGDFDHRQQTISATSGSTGEPFYFPRTVEQDMQYAAIAEMYLRTNFYVHKKSTLYIIGWGMGIWIGGVFSYEAVRTLADRGTYPISVITPGTSKEEILKAVQKLGPQFDQVLIGGYPPMIKDLVDAGERQGLVWKKYHCKFIFSAEGFTEAFRDYIARHAALGDIYRDTLNHYGTVDLGTMAHETPVSILIRRLAVKNSKLNQKLFGQTRRQPTLAQYIPELFYFEEMNKTVICSARSGIPLCRYDLVDTGGVLSFAAMRTMMMECGIDPDKEIKKAGISDTVWNLPFVYVFERRDFTVKWQGANIFPQEIRRALESASLSRFCTGKCTMAISYDRGMEQRLVIDVELKTDVGMSDKLRVRIQTAIVRELLRSNSEYAYLYRQLSVQKMTPVIRCRECGTPPFDAKGKHPWVKK